MIRAIPRSIRGALRDRHERWARDAVDADRAQDERSRRGRRSRSVLIPRRWYQVGQDASHRADDGGNKARSPGRLRRKPLKPFAQGVPDLFGEPVVTLTCVLSLFAHKAAGALDARHSLRPLFFEEGR
jgi:hypothetical protein